jgi:hypothetical protein
VSGQTFSARLEARKGVLQHTIDFEAGASVIFVEPRERKSEDGSTSVSIGFPALIVSGWVSEGDKFAELVARLLTEHYAKAADQ